MAELAEAFVVLTGSTNKEVIGARRSYLRLQQYTQLMDHGCQLPFGFTIAALQRCPKPTIDALRRGLHMLLETIDTKLVSLSFIYDQGMVVGVLSSPLAVQA